jgi:Putative transposase
VRVEAHDRKRLEPLCRCIARPALSDQRVQLNAAVQVELKLKTLRQPKGLSSARAQPARLSPLVFMQPLAALVHPPR